MYKHLGIHPSSFSVSIKKFGKIARIYGHGNYDELLIITEIFIDEAYLPPYDLHAIKTIIDCGANIGYSAVFFALRYENSTIYAYEPDPKTFQLLKKNAENLNIVCCNQAISDVSGEVSFFVHPEKNISSSLIKREDLYQSITVKSVTLEEAVVFAGDNVDIFKFDIEGGEFKIFNQKKQAISQIRYITGEIHTDIVNKEVGAITDILSATHTVTLMPANHFGRYICHALRK